MKDIRLGHTRAAVTHRVRVIGDLEHRTVDVLSVSGEKILDIITIDALPASKPKTRLTGWSRRKDPNCTHPTGGQQFNRRCCALIQSRVRLGSTAFASVLIDAFRINK
jgi:hypothetical protein